MMNNLDPRFAPEAEAKLEYLPSDFRIVKNGKFVLCAVTREPIMLEDLKYWSAERQEPYSSPQVALKRHLQVIGQL
jgi:hypothetical protein